MRIMVAHNNREWKGQPVQTYARSIVRVLQERGHEVVEADKKPHPHYNGIDFLLDVDDGRDAQGNLFWHGDGRVPNTHSGVYFVDSHGYPQEHMRIAKYYDHVFFAVWSKRDIFSSLDSAHWCPNFTDKTWFDGAKYQSVVPSVDFGFFGSRGGLDRADPLKKVAGARGWTADVRQINYSARHRWPYTAEEMAKCRALFNHGQKHDGPNLRVMESLAMARPLITNEDPLDGMSKLFIPYTHYLPYGNFNVHTRTYDMQGLEQAMEEALGPGAKEVAANGYREVMEKHLVENRVDQILEVICNG